MPDHVVVVGGCRGWPIVLNGMTCWSATDVTLGTSCGHALFGEVDSGEPAGREACASLYRVAAAAQPLQRSSAPACIRSGTPSHRRIYSTARLRNISHSCSAIRSGTGYLGYRQSQPPVVEPRRPPSAPLHASSGMTRTRDRLSGPAVRANAAWLLEANYFFRRRFVVDAPACDTQAPRTSGSCSPLRRDLRARAAAIRRVSNSLVW